MKKEEALRRFLAREENAASMQWMRAVADRLNKEKRGEIVREFSNSLVRALAECPQLSFLQITLHRYRALTGQPFYRLQAYGEDFYLTEPLCQTDLNLDWLYRPYNDYANALRQESRKYFGAITSLEVERILLAKLYSCNQIIKFLFAESLAGLLASKPYQALDAARHVQFHFAEYQGAYELLLTKDEQIKEMEGVLDELLFTEAAN